MCDPRRADRDVEGLIGYYGLVHWWLSAFTPGERQVVEATYGPTAFIWIGLTPNGDADELHGEVYQDPSSLTHGQVAYCSQLVDGFLNSLASWFRSKQHASIAGKIREKMKELAEADPLRGPGYVGGRHFTTYVTEIEALKRENRLAEAEELLLRLVSATEAEVKWSVGSGHVVAPWYYEQLAIVYRKRRDLAKEAAILERYLAMSGCGNAEIGTAGEKLRRRLERVRGLLEEG